ncbi:hypothetical protein FHY52_00270 [Nocardia nova]|nr:hypothetical protein [Nocardia nova]
MGGTGGYGSISPPALGGYGGTGFGAGGRSGGAVSHASMGRSGSRLMSKSCRLRQQGSLDGDGCGRGRVRRSAGVGSAMKVMQTVG